jgi:hypothetical protein
VLNTRNATGNWHRLNDTSECQLTGPTSAASMWRNDDDGNETLLKPKRKSHWQTPLTTGFSQYYRRQQWLDFSTDLLHVARARLFLKLSVMINGTTVVRICAVTWSFYLHLGKRGPIILLYSKRDRTFLNSAPTSIESALRLLSAPSVRFWQQTAICPVSLY